MLFRGSFILIAVIQYTTQVLLSQQNNDNPVIIIVDHTGNNECCYGNCTTQACSNLSLALQLIKSNTEIHINSSIPLYTLVELDRIVSEVNITGINLPTIQCNNQSGLHGKNINSIVIQDIKWEKCEVKISFSSNTQIINCLFQHSVGEFALILDSSTAHVENSAFVENSNGILVHLSTVIIHECHFIANSEDIEGTISDHNVNVSLGHGIHCSLSNLLLNFSYFINNTNSGVVLENSQFSMSGNVTFQQWCWHSEFRHRIFC